MTQHTKWKWAGNWLSDQNKNIVLWYTTNDDGVHCKAEHKDLIAAAPETKRQRDMLLEALEMLLNGIEEYQTINNLGGHNNQDQVFARAAILSCRGETP